MIFPFVQIVDFVEFINLKFYLVHLISTQEQMHSYKSDVIEL